MNRLTRLVIAGAAALGISSWTCTPPVRGDTATTQEAFDAGARAILTSREGLRSTLDFMESQPDLFLASRTLSKRTLTRDQRLVILQTWQTFLDHVLTLDAIGLSYADFEPETEADRKRAFKLAFAAFLVEYRFALDFLRSSERDPTLHVVLNESLPELGVPAGTYARVKYRFLNVLRGAELARLNAVDVYYGADANPALQQSMDEDKKNIWRAGAGSGPLLTVENGLQMLKDAGFTAWFPVQRGVSEWMGDVKVRRKGRSLVQPEQITAMGVRLEPGDVLLERREWYLSNVGLPGFWPHAALYIGTPEERSAYFRDEGVQEWLSQQPGSPADLDTLLDFQFPDPYRLSLQSQEDGHVPRVLEAISEGVVFTTLEHSAAADSVVVLRPRLSKREKAAAIRHAFQYSGRPYDFNFDFATDSELVCTELVAKAYEPRNGSPGLSFPLPKMLGRFATPANEIVRQFDEQHGTPGQQLDLVLFLDGYERKGAAVESDLETFRKSWRRPKWHVIVQDTPLSRE